MDDDLDQMLDATFGVDDDAEAAESDDAAAAESEPADGQDDDEAAAGEADEAAEAADAAPDEPDDELRQLRQRLEAVEAERAADVANQQAAQRQWQAADLERRTAANEAAWDAEYARREEAAWEMYGSDGPSYRAALAGIIAERDAKKAEFAAYRASRYANAYAASQLPAYAAYINEHIGLTGAEAAHIVKLATTPGVNPDSLPALAQSLKELAASKQQAQRAAKAASLQKTSGKPGGGSPHKPKPQTVDDYIDAMFG